MLAGVGGCKWVRDKWWLARIQRDFQKIGFDCFVALPVIELISLNRRISGWISLIQSKG